MSLPSGLFDKPLTTDDIKKAAQALSFRSLTKTRIVAMYKMLALIALPDPRADYSVSEVSEHLMRALMLGDIVREGIEDIEATDDDTTQE